jgi:hypothetical protein
VVHSKTKIHLFLVLFVSNLHSANRPICGRLYCQALQGHTLFEAAHVPFGPGHRPQLVKSESYIEGAISGHQECPFESMLHMRHVTHVTHVTFGTCDMPIFSITRLGGAAKNLERRHPSSQSQQVPSVPSNCGNDCHKPLL